MEPRFCSKAAKKKTVKIPKMATAKIRSLTILVYRRVLEMIRKRKRKRPIKIVLFEPLRLPMLKSRRLMPPILDKGSLKR